MPTVAGHGQGVDDQAGAHVVGHLPAQDHPGGQVEHGGQIQPSLPGTQIGGGTSRLRGHITDQPLAGNTAGGEVAPDQVRALDRVLTADSGALVGPWLKGGQPELAHQISHHPDRAVMARAVELRGHSPTAVGAPAGLEHPGHLDREFPSAGLPSRLHPVAPGIETRPRHVE